MNSCGFKGIIIGAGLFTTNFRMFIKEKTCKMLKTLQVS